MPKLALLTLINTLVAGPALAGYCHRDNVPAAALLVPFAQVGIHPDGTVDPNGATTILRITNVSSDAQTVHITIWNMFAQAVIPFDVILSGYDVVQMNLRDVLDGRLDLLADETSFNDALQKDGLAYVPGELGPDGRDWLKGALPAPEDRDQHAASGSNSCNKFPYGDYRGVSYFRCVRSKLLWPLQLTKTRPIEHRYVTGSGRGSASWLRPANITLDTLFFYVTAEVVRDCSILSPSQTAYWAADGPGPSYANVLIGHVLLVDAARGFSEAMPAVALEGDVDGTAIWNYYDQYSRVSGDNAAFEPLPTAFGIPYERSSGGGIEVTSSLLFFKTGASFSGLEASAQECFDEAWLAATSITNSGYVVYAWDMDELPMAIPYYGCPYSSCPPPWPPPLLNMLPFATQRVPITDESFDLPGESGWMVIALPAAYAEEYAPHSLHRAAGGTTFEPITNPTATMGWAAVQTTMRAPGAPFGYSAIIEAAVLGNRHCYPGDVLPALNTYDGAVADGALR